MLDELRTQRDAMLRYMEAHKVNGRLPGLLSYRLMHSLVECLEACERGDAQAARRSFQRWETLANQMLEAQLFAEPWAHAVSMSTGDTANGVDGCTVHMSEMIKQQREVLVAGMASLG